MDISRRGFLLGALALPLACALPSRSLSSEEASAPQEKVVTVYLNGKEVPEAQYTVRGDTVQLQGPFVPNSSGEIQVLLFYTTRLEPSGAGIQRTSRSTSYLHVIKKGIAESGSPVSISIERADLISVVFNPK